MNEILSQSIFFGIAITLVTYEIGLWIKQKTGKAIANPLLISVILIVAVLLLFHIDYETYANGAQYISFPELRQRSVWQCLCIVSWSC